MKKIKVAQIGVGHDHAADIATTLKLQNDIYDFVGYAVTEEDSENVEGFFECRKWAYEGIPQMTIEEILNYPGLDAVCIETEDRALTKYAMMAVEKGLHMHMDKPGGIDGNEFDRLIDCAKEKGIIFQTGYMYRYNPEIIKLKEKINSGELGEIYAVEAQMNCLHNAEKREWLGNYPGGMLYFLGCHLIDIIYSICGEPEEIIPLSTATGLDGVSADDFGMVIFKYKNGVSFAKSTAVEICGFERRQLVVCGSKGTIELRPIEWVVPAVLEGVGQQQITGVREAYGTGWTDRGICYDSEVYGRYDAMMREFAECVRGEKKNPFSYEYERNLHRLLLKSCGVK